MKTPLIATLTLLIAGSAVFAANTVMQEPEMPKPTAEHKALQMTTGNWEGTITMYMPGMDPLASPAKETVTAHGPFWVTSEFSSEFMGQKYKGQGHMGYDERTKEHQGTWVDNMGSYLSVMKGTMDKENNLLTMHWDAPDMTGQMAPHRSETVRSKNAYTIIFYTSDVKTMVIDMKRVAKADK